MQVAFLACLAVVLVLAPAAHAQGVVAQSGPGCDNADGWFSHSFVCYKKFHAIKNWQKATTFCEDLGGSLALAHDEGANAKLAQVAEGENVWLGGFIRDGYESTSEVVWADNVPSAYFTPWSEDPVVLNYKACIQLNPDGQWTGHSCGTASLGSKFICEKRNPQATPSCEDNWEFNGAQGTFREFCMIKIVGGGNFNWFSANRNCVAKSAHLVTIPDAETQDFIKDLVGGKPVWLGATVDEDTEEIDWISDLEPEYTNWKEGQPQFGDNPRGTCLKMSHEAYWKAASCINNEEFVCARYASKASFVCNGADDEVHGEECVAPAPPAPVVTEAPPPPAPVVTEAPPPPAPIVTEAPPPFCMEAQENAHAEGAVPRFDILELEPCLNYCLSLDACVAVDWAKSASPWLNCRCWTHMVAHEGVTSSMKTDHYTKTEQCA